MRKLLLYYNTIKYLRISQIFFRIVNKFKKIKIESDLNSTLSACSNWTKNYYHKAISLDGNVISLLGEKGDVFEWNDSQKEKIWLYNLHYLDYLNAKNILKDTNFTYRVLKEWIKSNEVGVGVGWEPYPLSLRIVNWVKYSLNGNDIPEEFLNSLTQQSQYLSKSLEYHLYGNHLFSNAKALFFAGCYLDNELSSKWLKTANKILSKELKEQILSDGGNFELSPMYHCIMLQDLLDLINISRSYENELLNCLDAELIESSLRMFEWLSHMTHPDGEISFFNDSAFQIAPNLKTLKKYAAELGVVAPSIDINNIIHLDESGFAILHTKQFKMIVDIGKIGPDYLPGHGHADVLSFELSVCDERLFVNSGTSVYGESKERQHQRGTSAHNTVEINSQNSSEVWGGFRVARRAYPKDIMISKRKIIAGHDGYKRLKGRNTHHREWHCFDNKILIQDCIEGMFEKCSAYFYLHPDITVVQKSLSSLILTSKKGTKVLFETSENEIQLRKSNWHPEFGLNIANNLLKIDFVKSSLKTTIEIL